MHDDTYSINYDYMEDSFIQLIEDEDADSIAASLMTRCVEEKGKGHELLQDMFDENYDPEKQDQYKEIAIHFMQDAYKLIVMHKAYKENRMKSEFSWEELNDLYKAYFESERWN